MTKIGGAIVLALAVLALAAGPPEYLTPSVQMVGLHIQTRHVWIMLDSIAAPLTDSTIRQIVCFAAYDHDRRTWNWPPEKTTYTVEQGTGKARTVLISGEMKNCKADEAISPWSRGAPTPPFATSVPERPR